MYSDGPLCSLVILFYHENFAIAIVMPSNYYSFLWTFLKKQWRANRTQPTTCNARMVETPDILAVHLFPIHFDLHIYQPYASQQVPSGLQRYNLISIMYYSEI